MGTLKLRVAGREEHLLSLLLSVDFTSSIKIINFVQWFKMEKVHLQNYIFFPLHLGLDLEMIFYITLDPEYVVFFIYFISSWILYMCHLFFHWKDTSTDRLIGRGPHTSGGMDSTQRTRHCQCQRHLLPGRSQCHGHGHCK